MNKQIKFEVVFDLDEWMYSVWCMSCGNYKSLRESYETTDLEDMKNELEFSLIHIEKNCPGECEHCDGEMRIYERIIIEEEQGNPNTAHSELTGKKISCICSHDTV